MFDPEICANIGPKILKLEKNLWKYFRIYSFLSKTSFSEDNIIQDLSKWEKQKHLKHRHLRDHLQMWEKLTY